MVANGKIPCWLEQEALWCNRSIFEINIEKIGTNLENQYIIIAHSNREDYANLLKEKIEEKKIVKKVFITDVFSGCGTNIGPGMIGAYFMGNPISNDCLVEKEALTQSIKENTK